MLRLSDWTLPILSQKIKKNQDLLQNSDIQSTILYDGHSFFEYISNETKQVYKEIFVDNIYLRNGISLREDAIIFDIGANIGLFSFFVSRVCENATIYAFEPVQAIFDILKANVDLYDLRVWTSKSAIGNENREDTISFYPKSSLQSGFYTDIERDAKIMQHIAYNSDNNSDNSNYENLFLDRFETTKQKVEVQTISDIIEKKQVPRIDLLKIDAEKSELEILEGIKDSHWLIIDQLVIEIHDTKKGYEKINNLLNEKGYVTYSEEFNEFKNSGIRMLYASRNRNIESYEEKQISIRSEQFVSLLETNIKQKQIWVGVCQENRICTRLLQSKLEKRIKLIPNVEVIEISKAVKSFNLIKIHNTYNLNLAGIPYTDSYFSLVAMEIIRATSRNKRSRIKVIAVDLDNSLWSGICGEVAPNKLVINKDYKQFQEYLLKLKQNGILLAILSKNNLDDAKKVFEELSMPLRWNDFVCHRINWKDKWENILDISNELNLSIDSFLFLDDDQRERASMRIQCPMVNTVELPEDPSLWVQALKQTWKLEMSTNTTEDINRTVYYKNESKRNKVFKQYHSFSEFLKYLQIRVIIKRSIPEEINRLVQLSNRTNQFNLTTSRKDLSELLIHVKLKKNILSIFVSDRFGDYGLAGSIIYVIEKNTLIVEDFLLSCRILGKNIEWRIMNHLGEFASYIGCSQLRFNIKRNNRNRPSQLFFDKLNPDKHFDSNTFVINSSALIRLDWLQQKVNRTTQIEDRNALSTISDLNYEWPSPGPIFPDQLLAVLPTNVRKRPSSLPNDYIAPRSELEYQLVTIWEDELSISKIGIQDKFNSLGGDSISAIRLIVRIKEIFDFEIGIYDALESTISSLSYNISSKKNYESKSNESYSVNVAPFASIGQIRLWASDEISNHNDNIIPIAYEINGELNNKALYKAFRLVFEKHVILHTNLKYKSGEIYQIENINLDFAWEEIDLHATGRKFDEILKHKFAQKFNLLTDALMRVNLFKINKGFVLVVIFHHSAFDGWSINKFHIDLSQYYLKFLYSNEVIFEKDDSFIKYSKAQKRTLANPSFIEKKKSWVEQFPKVTEQDYKFKLTNSYNGTSMVIREVPKSLDKRIKLLTRQNNITNFTIYLSAWQKLINSDNLFRTKNTLTIHANRQTNRDLDSIGFFANLILIKHVDPFDKTKEEYWNLVHKSINQTLVSGNIPFGLIQSEIEIPIGVFSLQNIQKNPLKLENCYVEEVDVGYWPCPFPVMVDIEESLICTQIRFRFQEGAIPKFKETEIVSTFMKILNNEAK